MIPISLWLTQKMGVRDSSLPTLVLWITEIRLISFTLNQAKINRQGESSIVLNTINLSPKSLKIYSAIDQFADLRFNTLSHLPNYSTLCYVDHRKLVVRLVHKVLNAASETFDQYIVMLLLIYTYRLFVNVNLNDYFLTWAHSWDITICIVFKFLMIYDFSSQRFHFICNSIFYFSMRGDTDVTVLVFFQCLSSPQLHWSYLCLWLWAQSTCQVSHTKSTFQEHPILSPSVSGCYLQNKEKTWK